MRTFLMPIIVLIMIGSCEQAPSAASVLKKSIQYHDPDGHWAYFKGKFAVHFVKDDSLRSVTEVEMDIPGGKFRYKQAGVEAGVTMDSCFSIAGDRTCDQIKRTRNYYVYLWGLPMKLMDAGTKLEDTLSEEAFNGTACYVINVRYEKDVWYYYVNKKNFALKGYMFYQDEPNKRGEVIYLKEEEVLDGMRIPKKRMWFTTPGNELLGTDMLVID